MALNTSGIIIGIATFLIIGFFHPVVIKAEYHFGVKCWWAFLVTGLAAIGASLFIPNQVLSILCAVFGASALWGIGELFQQRKRVERGWFPKKPD